MKKTLIIGLIFMVGCFQANRKAPDHLLDRDEMVNLMIHVHVLESEIFKLHLKDDSAKVLYSHFEGLMLDSLGISKEQYEESLEYYYTENIKEMKKVYDRVVDSLSLKHKTFR